VLQTTLFEYVNGMCRVLCVEGHHIAAGWTVSACVIIHGVSGWFHFTTEVK